MKNKYAYKVFGLFVLELIMTGLLSGLCVYWCGGAITAAIGVGIGIVGIQIVSVLEMSRLTDEYKRRQNTD